MNLRAIPVVRLLLPFIIGIAYAMNHSNQFSILESWSAYFWAFTLVLLIILTFSKWSYHWRWVFGVFLFGVLFSLGVWRTLLHHQIFKNHHFSNQIEREGFFIGQVKALKHQGKHWRTILNIKAASSDAKEWYSSSGQLLSYFPSELEQRTLKRGQLLFFQAGYRLIQPPANPYTFDFQHYSKLQNIYHQAFIKPGTYQIINNQTGTQPLLFWFADCRDQVLQLIEQNCTLPEVSSIVSAMVLGIKDQLPKDLQRTYANAGAMHVLAVSGLHVGILYLIVHFCFTQIMQWLGWPKKWILLPVLLFVWSYVLLTGCGPSAWRAGLMLSLFAIGKQFSHYLNTFNIMAATAFIMLWVNPFQLYDVGFQLSFLALSGILVFQPLVYRLWYCPWKWLDYLWKLVSVGIAAQIATFPIGIYYFHQFPVYSWLSGILVVPAASLILSFSLLGIGSSGLGMDVGMWWVLEQLIVGLHASLHWIEMLPMSTINQIWVSNSLVWSLYLVILLFLGYWQLKNKWMYRAALGLSMVILLVHQIQNFSAYHRAQMVIYDVSKHSMIDFIHAFRTTSLVDSTMSNQTMEYVAGPYRSFTRANNVAQIPMNRPHIMHDQLIKKGPFIDYLGKWLFLFDANQSLDEWPKMNVDYVCLKGNPETTIKAILEKFNPSLVIIDGSNAPWKVHEWLQDSLLVDIHYTRESGALIIDC